MTYNDIIAALEAKGWGAKDFMTQETFVDSAILNEDINGGGGLSLSWKSTEGGVIPAGATLLGYVMIEPYVPSLGDDGIYTWSPKFSEKAALLAKNYYSKELTMRRADGKQDVSVTIEGEKVVAVVEEDNDLVYEGSYFVGAYAIVKNPVAENSDHLRVLNSNHRWGTSETVATEGKVYQNVYTGDLWEYTSEGWREKPYGEVTRLYSHAYAGTVRTIVDDLNNFLQEKMGDGWEIIPHDDHDPDTQQWGDGSLAKTNVVCTFNGQTIKEVIETLANAAGEAYTGNSSVNLYYVGKKIHLGLSDAYSAESYYNRFIILGGTKNMAKRVAAGNAYAAITQRLSIPQGTYSVDGESVTVLNGSIIDMRTEPDEAPMEKFLVWDDIYPKLNLTIQSVTPRLCYLFDDNGNKIVDHYEENGEGTEDDVPVYKIYCKWYITLTLNGSTTYELDTRYIIQDKPLSILFQSGPLTGREFEVTYFSQPTVEHDADDVTEGGHTAQPGEFRIILQAEGEMLLPTLDASYDNGGLCPQVGNVVTLVNVAIEDNFKEIARQELLAKGYAMAKLISSGKQSAWNEERTVPDVITGETATSPTLGQSVGQQLDGYVVTGIETNIITGETKYSWGTFKPKGLLSGAIDQIVSLSLSGGEASFAPLVSVTKDGSGNQIIYVGNATTGGSADENSSITSGGTSQASVIAIRQAGGNTNIKTVYDVVESIEREGGENAIFAELARLLYEHRETLEPKWDSALVELKVDGASHNGYWYEDSSYGYKTGGSIEPELASALAAVYELIGSATFTCYVEGETYDRKPVSANENDLYIKPLMFTLHNQQLEGGIQAWQYKKIENTYEWLTILESTTGVIDNLGDAISIVVFGSTGHAVEGSGVFTTQNFVELFSKATDGNQTLAEAAFGVGIRYRVSENIGGETKWLDVVYDSSERRWEYATTTDGYHDAGDPVDDQDAIEAYGFAGLSADMINFNGKNIVLESNYATTFKYGNDIALQVTGGGLVNMANTTMASANVNTELTTCGKRMWLHHNDLTSPKLTEIVVRSARSNELTNNHIIELGMKEFAVGNNVAANSYLNISSFMSDWSTSLGYINMKCGKGDGTGPDDRYCEIVMGVSNTESGGNKDVVKIEAMRSIDGSQYNYIAVRGRFAILEEKSPTEQSSPIYGIGYSDSPVQFKAKDTSGNEKTLTVIGGIITSIS